MFLTLAVFSAEYKKHTTINPALIAATLGCILKTLLLDKVTQRAITLFVRVHDHVHVLELGKQRALNSGRHDTKTSDQNGNPEICYAYSFIFS